MFKAIALIGVGGGIGSILRYLLTNYTEARFVPSSFPYGTLLVNISGCFVIGLIYALSTKLNMSPELRGFLATGICGGYTTFSAFSYQSINLMRDGHATQFLAYVFGSVILGLAATLIPIMLVEKFS